MKLMPTAKNMLACAMFALSLGSLQAQTPSPSVATSSFLPVAQPSTDPIGSYARGATVQVYAPSITPSGPMPLVVLLHDKCEDAQSIEAEIPLAANAEKVRLIHSFASKSRIDQFEAL